MWSAIKKALNSTLGEKFSEPLDVLAKKNAYQMYYNLTKGLAPQITRIEDTDVSFGNYDLPRLGVKTYDLTNNKNGFIPYGVEKITGKVTLGIGVIYIPRTVKEIENLSAFAQSSALIIIDNKKGSIEGEPWGHELEHLIIYLED